jgi:hypothetical protein
MRLLVAFLDSTGIEGDRLSAGDVIAVMYIIPCRLMVRSNRVRIESTLAKRKSIVAISGGNS